MPESIQMRLATIRSQIADHNLAIKKLVLDIERVRLDCPHEHVSGRSIGYANERWQECDDCGKENP
jgi:hypothetical protein